MFSRYRKKLFQQKLIKTLRCCFKVLLDCGFFLSIAFFCLAVGMPLSCLPKITSKTWAWGLVTWVIVG